MLLPTLLRRNAPQIYLHLRRIVNFFSTMAVFAARWPRLVLGLFLTWHIVIHASADAANTNAAPGAQRIQHLDELSALWSYYKYSEIIYGRVVSRDEGSITTSEGQGYALLRAVWSNDKETFLQVLDWTERHLQVRADKLFAWKWNGRVLDSNSATDADTDIGLALILASRQFAEPKYLLQAQDILRDIWAHEIVQAGDRYYVSAGNWAPNEKQVPLHVAYFAPYAYEIFAAVDPKRPWKKLSESSYEVLRWVYFRNAFKVPPEIVYLNKATGALALVDPSIPAKPVFGYDSVPLFWRLALDAQWSDARQADLRRRVLDFFQREWREHHKIVDRYALDGAPLSATEGLPHYASIYALALREDPAFAHELWVKKLQPLWNSAIAGETLPYYLQNWLWFSRALELDQARTFDEFLGFLRPFDFQSFSMHFPWLLAATLLLSFIFARRFYPAKIIFLAAGMMLSWRYLQWRLTDSLNFVETSGPFISVALWLAEVYCVATVLLLLVQVGMRNPRKAAPKDPAGTIERPSVDVFIPIYSESLAILEKTLIGAQAMRYDNKRIYVLDDSHRLSVAELASAFGATYIRGPKKHAKAGNVNHALSMTHGELVVVFDTDHIPMTTFLEETVPLFADPRMAVVQTPHHFYNEDIFQRAFLTAGRIPNEQDMFNHAIQNGRAGWGGAFFVGSGAVFRRRALEEVGGFQLLSITEDIHTSQHLHARSWKSAYVGKILAVGLAAENLASYLVQRRRWMLGCLQIFLKDNPLFQRGLRLRHRLGYFASLFYFFHPLPRVIFLVTPLYFLLFHWHPIFSDVSVLLAYLLPYMVALPMVASILLPGWPRLVWGSVYEVTAALPLFRSMFDLFLPKSLGFKVTPKGIMSERRIFDLTSSMLTLIALAISLFAIGKGLFEFYYFQIERDAYFFNMSWAVVNSLFLLVALLMGWEHPQRRGDERVTRRLAVTLRDKESVLTGTTENISLSGLVLKGSDTLEDGRELGVELSLPDGVWHTRAELVYQDRFGTSGPIRLALRFNELDAEAQRRLVVALFTDAEAWRDAHAQSARSNLAMLYYFFARLPRALFAARPLRRKQPRRRVIRIGELRIGQMRARILIRNDSAYATGGYCMMSMNARAIGDADLLHATLDGAPVRLVHLKRLMPGWWRVGIEADAHGV